MTMDDRLWWYRAKPPRRVVDGDTLDIELDAGMHTYRIERLRLLGVNAPELHAQDQTIRAAAQAAKAYATAWFAEHAAHATNPDWPFLLHTEKSDVFGRYLANVTCGQEHSLNADLLASGNAVVFQASRTQEHV